MAFSFSTVFFSEVRRARHYGGTNKYIQMNEVARDESAKKYTNKTSRDYNLQVDISSYICVQVVTDFMIDVGMSTCIPAMYF